MSGLGIHYADDEPFRAAGTATQAVRRPDEMLTERRGTCLDLMLLMAGLCAHERLRSLLVVLRGHAFLAVDLTRWHGQGGQEPPPDQLFEDSGLLAHGGLEQFRERIARGKYAVVECTGFSHVSRPELLEEYGHAREAEGLLSFATAQAVAAQHLTNPNPGFELDFVLDVERAFGAGGIRPLTLPVATSVAVFGAPAVTQYFTGRTRELGDLETALAQHRVGVLRGMPGSGKSQLAARYAHTHRAQYDHVWWVRAEQSETASLDLARLATELQLAPADGEMEQRVAAALRWLAGGERWLVVYDNAVDPELVLVQGTHEPVRLRDAITTGQGHVVLTSREPAWAGVAHDRPLGTMDKSDAIELLAHGHEVLPAAPEPIDRPIDETDEETIERTPWPARPP